MKSIFAAAMTVGLLTAPIASASAQQPADNDYHWNGDRDSDWDPSRHYTRGTYEQREMAENERVYHGSDGRYYCRRSDGTTGLVIGAGVGALVGRGLDGGRNRAGGTIVGGVLGALLGREVDRNADVRCR